MSQRPTTLDSERARELLPWLLNDTLDGDERTALLAALREDPALRRELADTHWAGRLFARHLPTADVVAYAIGEATDTDRTLVESHLASCGECRDELALARESLAARDRDADEDIDGERNVVPFARPAERPPAAGGVSPGWRIAAMAAALAAVVGLGGWLTGQRQAGERRELLTARVGDLVTSLEAAARTPGQQPAGGGAVVGDVGFPAATVRAAAAEAKRLVLSGESGVAELRFLPEDGPGSPVYEVRLLAGEEGRELLRITPLLAGADEVLRARVAAGELPSEMLTAVLYRSDPAVGWREVERHRVRVVRRGGPE